MNADFNTTHMNGTIQIQYFDKNISPFLKQSIDHLISFDEIILKQNYNYSNSDATIIRPQPNLTFLILDDYDDIKEYKYNITANESKVWDKIHSEYDILNRQNYNPPLNRLPNFITEVSLESILENAIYNDSTNNGFAHNANDSIVSGLAPSINFERRYKAKLNGMIDLRDETDINEIIKGTDNYLMFAWHGDRDN